ncbi:TPA: hypothetical protein ACWSRY_003163 [Escherichia coli]
MTLLELLRQELPKRGGWPEGALSITQDNDGSLCVWDTNDPHYDGLSWKHHTGNSLMYFWHGEWVMPLASDHKESIVTYWQYKAALSASQKPAWDGEGLPPVGVECEYMKHTRSTGNNWSKGTVKYISEYTVVIDDDDVDGEFIAHPLGCAFRPLRTEAERAIDEMVRLSGVSIGAAKILYDAGYRK